LKNEENQINYNVSQTILNLIHPNSEKIITEEEELNFIKKYDLAFELETKNLFKLSPLDFKTGGTGYVLYLEQMRFWAIVFFIISVINIPL